MSYGYPVASPARIVGNSAGLLLTDGTYETRFVSSLSISSDIVITLPPTQGDPGDEIVRTISGSAFIAPPTMTDVGGGVSIVNTPIPKNYVLKSFVAGNEISLTSFPGYIQITNTSPISDITFTSAGGDYAFVDGSSSGQFKGLEIGTGIDLVNSTENIIIANLSPSSIITLEPSTTDISLISNTSANPNFVLKSVTCDSTLQIVDNGTYFSINKVMGFASVVVMIPDSSEDGDWNEDGWRNVDFTHVETNESNANVLFALDTTPDVSGMDITNTTATTQTFLIDAWLSKAHGTARQAIRIASGTDLLPNVITESWGMQSCTEVAFYNFIVNISGTVIPIPSGQVIGIPGFPLLIPVPLIGYTKEGANFRYENSIQMRQSARISVEPFTTKRIRLDTYVQTTGKKFAASPGTADWYGPDQQVTGGYNLLGDAPEPILGWMRAIQLS